MIDRKNIRKGMIRMREIEKNIVNFLLEGSAYSDTAIMKNFGISEKELKEIYLNLIKNGYLETYEEYEKRESETSNKKMCGSNCNKCNCNNHENEVEVNEKKCCSEKDENLNKKNILVLTEKSLNL